MVSSPPAEAGSSGKIPLGRTQSAQPCFSTGKDVMPAPSVTSQSEGATRVEGFTSFGMIRNATTSAAANSSPSRESREAAEEVARQVVSCR